GIFPYVYSAEVRLVVRASLVYSALVHGPGACSNTRLCCPPKAYSRTASGARDSLAPYKAIQPNN
ncbi:MAG: hypothetical protein VX223_16615, partial [Myxococcota bacterium]|nr:hypothetical protein [Myxococcota bacterium]